MLPLFGTCAELALAPKRDLIAGGAAGCEAMMEPLEAVTVGALAKPGKTDEAAVVLLADAPNIEDVELEEAAERGLVVVRDGGCPKLPLEETPPKMGLKSWTGGLLSVAVVAAVEVVVTAKMGLKPEESRGLLLVTGPELLTGAAAVMGFDAEEAAAVLTWLASPKRPAPAAGVALLEALET